LFVALALPTFSRPLDRSTRAFGDASASLFVSRGTPLGFAPYGAYRGTETRRTARRRVRRRTARRAGRAVERSSRDALKRHKHNQKLKHNHKYNLTHPFPLSLSRKQEKQATAASLRLHSRFTSVRRFWLAIRRTVERTPYGDPQPAVGKTGLKPPLAF
jgi:hypothetical protein